MFVQAYSSLLKVRWKGHWAIDVYTNSFHWQ